MNWFQPPNRAEIILNVIARGTHQGDPLSLILGLGVNPFPSRSINRTPPSVRRANQDRATCMTIIVLPFCTRSGWGLDDVSLSENSASSDREFGQSKDLLRRWWKEKTCKTKCCHDYKDLTASKKKKLSWHFFHCSRFTQQKYDTFSRREAVLKIDLLGKGLTQGISGDIASPWTAPLSLPIWR